MANECAHTQSMAQKLSSYLKSWTSLPSLEAREYSKSIKATQGQLATTQRELANRTEALDGLSDMFDGYHAVESSIKRLNSKISLADLDDQTLTRIQDERSELTSTLNECLNRAQTLDDKVSGLSVIVHTEKQSGPAVELYDHTKKVSGCSFPVVWSLLFVSCTA